MARHHPSNSSGTRPAVREHYRVPADLPVRCELAGGGSISGVARDISLGGAFLSVDGRPAFGETVVLELAIPGRADPLRVSAVVRWCDSRGFGVQFGLLGARDTNVIVRLLNDLRGQPTSSRHSASRA